MLLARLSALLLAATLLPADAPAPPFALAMLDGGRVESGALRGRLVVLNLWATWCAPCRGELSDLDAYAAVRGRRVAAFAVLAERDPDPRLLARQRAAMRLSVARGFAQGGIAYPPRNGAVPTTYVIDPDGRLALVKAGAFRPGELARDLDALLAQSGN